MRSRSPRPEQSLLLCAGLRRPQARCERSWSPPDISRYENKTRTRQGTKRLIDPKEPLDWILFVGGHPASLGGRRPGAAVLRICGAGPFLTSRKKRRRGREDSPAPALSGAPWFKTGAAL